jgi:hypothetical protein
MKTLETNFRRKRLLYTLIKSNNLVALYGVGGEYTDNPINWEVCRIKIRNDHSGIRAAIPTDEEFGRDGEFVNQTCSLCFPQRQRKEAEEYFDILTKNLQGLISLK